MFSQSFFDVTTGSQGLEQTNVKQFLFEASEEVQEEGCISPELLSAVGLTTDHTFKEAEDELSTRVIQNCSREFVNQCDDVDDKSSSCDTQSCDAVWNLGEPSKPFIAKALYGISTRHHYGSTTRTEYDTQGSMSTTVNGGIKKLRTAYQHLLPSTKESSYLPTTENHRALRWKELVKRHAAIILLLVCATLFGSYHSTIKWTQLSTRLIDVTLSDIVNGKSNRFGVDFDFAHKVLFSKSLNLEAFDDDVKTIADNFLEHADDKMAHDLRVSIFIPANERRIYSERRKLENRADLLPDFSRALVCTQLIIDNSHYQENFPVTKYVDMPDSKHTLDDISALSSCIVPRDKTISASNNSLVTNSAEEQHTRRDYKFSIGSIQRKCSVWSVNSQLKPTLIPSIIQYTRGLIAPNYLLMKPTERLVNNPIYFVGLVLIVWSHSLALPQPISLIHGPRLLFYMAAIIWRISILYNGLGFIECLPLIQTLLMTYNRQFDFSGNWSSTTFADKVDFSDHVVVYHLFAFVMSTEGFCLSRFREVQLSLTVAGDDSTSNDTKGTSLSNTIDNPFEVPSKLLQCITLSITGFNILMAYCCFITATFYHSPLESILASVIAIMGIYLVFWFLVVTDRVISCHHFGIVI